MPAAHHDALERLQGLPYAWKAFGPTSKGWAVWRLGGGDPVAIHRAVGERGAPEAERLHLSILLHTAPHFTAQSGGFERFAEACLDWPHVTATRCSRRPCRVMAPGSGTAMGSSAVVERRTRQST